MLLAQHENNAYFLAHKLKKESNNCSVVSKLDESRVRVYSS